MQQANRWLCRSLGEGGGSSSATSPCSLSAESCCCQQQWLQQQACHQRFSWGFPRSSKQSVYGAGNFVITERKTGQLAGRVSPQFYQWDAFFLGSGVAQWLEHWTHDWKVVGSNPCRSSGRIFFFRVDFLCWLLFQYPFHPRVTAVAHKRSWSFSQKCRWQVSAKHTYTLHMWLCMKWHGAWLYGRHRTCTKMATVSCGTSHASAVRTPLRWIFKNTL